jgi:hypothetical protein
MLHTVIPLEYIMEGSGAAAKEAEKRTEVVAVSGGLLELCRDREANRTVSRLLSTDPKLFLRPGYSPGKPYKNDKV